MFEFAFRFGLFGSAISCCFLFTPFFAVDITADTVDADDGMGVDVVALSVSTTVVEGSFSMV